MKNVRAVHVIPSVAEEASGGSYAVLRLCQSLMNQGQQVELHCLAAPDHGYKNFVHVHRPGLGGLRPLGYSPDLYRGMLAGARQSDIIHNHSLWMIPNVYPAWVARKTNCRLVTSPHGTLSPWALARTRWLKRLFWLIQRDALVRAACIHATDKSEYHDARDLGIRVPVAIIPLGIDIPEKLRVLDPLSKRRLLFLGRIHEKKGVDILLRVWRQIEPAFPDWELNIVGPGQAGYVRLMQRLAQNLGLRRAFFLGPRYGVDKSRCYGESDLFVLPTHSENFALAVAESLAYGVPAVVTQGAPWEGLERNRCGWWIPLSEESLYKTLYKAMSMSVQDLRAMGTRGREWMRREFAWEEVGLRMAKTYEWLLGGGETPPWVKLD